MDKLSTLPLTSPSPEPRRFEISPEVRKALGALALAVNHGLEEEQLRVTAFALRDLSDSLIRRACLKLAETERFWPKPVDIRTCANTLARADAIAAAGRHLPPSSGEKTYQCWKCRDDENGWMLLMRCPDIPCDREREHYAHEFTVRCPCWLRKNADLLKLSKELAMKEKRQIPQDCELLEELEMGFYRWDKPAELWK